MAAALPAIATVPIVAPSGVFKGRELTRKDRRLSAPMAAVNAMLEGGIPRGRISEIAGRRSCGKTSLAAAFISSSTRRGEVAAVIDLGDAFDPSTMAQAGVDLSRVLWVSVPSVSASSPISLWERVGERMPERRKALNSTARNFLRASEMVLEAGGFGLVLMDFGESAFALPQSSALRLARMAERSGTAVLILASRPVCGTFAALSLDLISTRAIFSRDAKSGRYLKCIRHPHPRPLPRKIVGEGTEKALFDGIEIKATLRRNKIGRCGLSAQWQSLISPSDSNFRNSASVISPTSVRERGDKGDRYISINA